MLTIPDPQGRRTLPPAVNSPRSTAVSSPASALLTRSALSLAATLILLAPQLTPAAAVAQTQERTQQTELGIDPKLGESVPLDMTLVDEGGNEQGDA